MEDFYGKKFGKSIFFSAVRILLQFVFFDSKFLTKFFRDLKTFFFAENKSGDVFQERNDGLWDQNLYLGRYILMEELRSRLLPPNLLL